MTRKSLPSYVFSQDAIANVSTAYVYLSLFNPVGSGKFLVVGGLFVSSTITIPSSVPDSLRGWRITAASGGTLQLDSAVAKVQSNFPDPVAEVRTGNPTVTLGAALFNSPAPIENKASSVHEINLPPGAPPFTLVPGEGIAVRTAAGAGTGATWNISVVWAEGP